ncbi:MAG: lipoyl(octanoyl) transferase LipB [Cyanobacteriota bacterium]|nr:lipoyl(octanoyl) transferase LipB [Cyanobacteriota bacterium]
MAPRLDAILFDRSGGPPLAFQRGWQLQQRLQSRLLVHPAGPDAVVLLQHEPCYTLGRGADPAHLHFDLNNPPLPTYRVDRGGEVTHHCPGQLVLYPVLNLQRHGTDLHVYLRDLEQVVIDLIGLYGLRAGRLDGLTGVWLEGRKLAAIGVGARRWITQHGLALNVNCNLGGFSQVVPCGITDRPVGRLADWRADLTAEAVAPALLEAFAERFSLQLRPPLLQDTPQEW